MDACIQASRLCLNTRDSLQRGRFQLESEWTNECEFDYELQDRSHSSASRPDGALPHYPRPALVRLSLHRHAGE